MSVHNLKRLIGKLNPECKTVLEGAAGLCQSQGHYEVELEHFLLKLMEAGQLDFNLVLAHFQIRLDRLQRDVVQAFERLKRGNTRTPVLSTLIPQMIEAAWLVASLEQGATQLRSGHLLLGLLQDVYLKKQLIAISAEFEAIDANTLNKDFEALLVASEEARSPATAETPPLTASHAMTATPALDQYANDLTAQAQAGKIDPVLGRDAEIRQMIDILMRRRQNNPILTGEAGVGKTSVVEGLALQIVAKAVPLPLQNIRLLTLDLGLLQAGASVKGEFESRLRNVIDEVKKSPTPVILFIDEAHTLIGAGGQAGQNDAANLLKPALARGELRTIAATTWSEYKKFFEKDAALSRRFQVVKVDEPSEAQAIAMMRGVVDAMQKHHQVIILDEAVVDAVKLSARFLTGRQLPDKCVSVLDTACARVAISQAAVPSPIVTLRSKRADLQKEQEALQRDARLGRVHTIRASEITGLLAAITEELAVLEPLWQAQLAAVAALHKQLMALPSEADDAARQPILQALSALAAQQGDAPLVHLCVDQHVVAEVISAWTGVPLGKMLKDELQAVRQLDTLLAQRVIGQDEALRNIARRIQSNKAKLEDPAKPIGVFLLVGPSGVGKTETALALADSLLGGERNLITINMSEFQEAHTVSSLKGSPPGYVGYGEGGVLTEAVRRKPYSVVLLDEIEKAHPDVLELFFQVFDKGRLDDAEGREIDFKNTIILLTSNVGTATIMQLCPAMDRYPDADQLKVALHDELQEAFKPAFLGRLQVIPYYPVRDAVLKQIIALKLAAVSKRVLDHHQTLLAFDESVINVIASRCNEVDSGARNIDHILTGTLLPLLSAEFLTAMAQGQTLPHLQVSWSSDDNVFQLHQAATVKKRVRKAAKELNHAR